MDMLVVVKHHTVIRATASVTVHVFYYLLTGIDFLSELLINTVTSQLGHPEY